MVEHTKQKFKTGQKVFITNKMPSYMSHFTCGINALVIGTYSQMCYDYDKHCYKEYELLLLDNNDKPFSIGAWYKESQLKLVDSDINKGKKIIQKYMYEEKKEK